MKVQDSVELKDFCQELVHVDCIEEWLKLNEQLYRISSYRNMLSIPDIGKRPVLSEKKETRTTSNTRWIADKMPFTEAYE